MKMGRAREILFEFKPCGPVVRVSAIDAESGTEVSIVGAAKASQYELQAVASRKLHYVMQKGSRQASPR